MSNSKLDGEHDAPRVPFRERLTCSVGDAEAATDLSRSQIYLEMGAGRIEWVKVGKRRLIKVPSLMRRLGAA